MKILSRLFSRARIALLAAAFLPLSALQVQGFTHPGIPLTVDDLNAIKSNLQVAPWKTGYEALAADGHSQLAYRMRGPFEHVSRNPHLHRNEWMDDMQAVFNLSRMWFFTGKNEYAQKAHDILLAWARTQKTFDGMENALDLGDYAYRFAGGADILRGTWPGWTPEDTKAVQGLFENVYWPCTGGDGNILGPANKGMLQLASAVAIAVFNDDQAKLDHVVALFRNQPACGLLNTLPTGQVGESGRDQGHAYGQWVSMAFVAEVLWKQGIDVYSDLDNRLLGTGEFFARNNLGIPTMYIPFGTIDAHYVGNSAVGWPHGRLGLNILRGAYVIRKGMSAPYSDLRRASQPVDMDSFVFDKPFDSSTAKPLPRITLPAMASVSTGLSDLDIGDATPGGSTYDNGRWTVKGAGREIWGPGADSFHFTYKELKGDCAMVARVESVENTSGGAKAGVMLRQSLDADTPNAWVAITPAQKLEFCMNGWTGLWAGSNFEKRARDIPKGPYWVRIQRVGKLVTVFTSPDGMSWAAACVGEFGGITDSIYLGLAVCSLDNTRTNTSTFSQVYMTGGDGGAPSIIPAAPVALLASPGNGEVPLRWPASFGATGYKVKRSTTRGGPYKTVATVAGSSYLDTSVTDGVTYYYVVSATNAAGKSANSPEETVTPMGAMVNVARLGRAKASAGAEGSEGAARALDGDPGSKWFTGNSGPGAWLECDFGSDGAQTVKRYTIVSGNDAPERNPKSWELQGSNDGASWKNLDSQSDQSFPFVLQPHISTIKEPAPFRYYRLNITANNGANGIQLSELGLYADNGPLLPEGAYCLVDRSTGSALGVSGEGAGLVRGPYTSGAAQKWTFSQKGNGQYEILARNGTTALEAGSKPKGAVKLNGRSGEKNQLWTLSPASDGCFRLISVPTGKAVYTGKIGGSAAEPTTKAISRRDAASEWWIIPAR